MGSAGTCTFAHCRYTAERVTADFDHGFSADVTTPISCPRDGVQQVMTGLKAWDDCREPTMDDNPLMGLIMWD